jgi:hypothetical protein
MAREIPRVVGRRLNKQLPRVGFRGHRLAKSDTHDASGETWPDLLMAATAAPRQNNLRRPLLINSAIALLTWRMSFRISFAAAAKLHLSVVFAPGDGLRRLHLLFHLRVDWSV